MRHKRRGRKLGVVTKHRRAMLRNMVTDFLRHERVRTTDTRAKELKRLAERMITLAKLGTLHARRRAAEVIRDKGVLKRLFDEVAPKYKDRPGGYTRIVKLGVRRGDNAPISVLELVGEELKPKRKKRTKAPTEKGQPPTETPEVRSRKKEAAEELGLVGEEKSKEIPPSAEASEAAEAKSPEKETPPQQEETPSETKRGAE